jgi:SSS family transporter
MTWIADHWLRLLFVGAYLIVLAHHAWVGTRETKDLDDYLIAGRGLGGWVIALSFYATFVSTNSFIGHAGKGWDVGLIWYVKGAVIGLSAYAAWYLVAPRFCAAARQYDSLTLPDFLGHRYRSPALRRAAAVVVVTASVLFLVAVYKGSALALQAFLGLDYTHAAVAIFIVVTSYTLVGGFRSVVLTDAVQAVLMLAGAVVMFFAVIHHGGGLPAILGELRAQDPALVSWQGNMSLGAILGLSLAGGMKLLVDPRQISRMYGLKDEKALRLARTVAPLLILITYICLLPIGVFARALIPAGSISDSDQVMPYLLGTSEVLGPVLSSFFLLVLVSAAMSSLDSALLVAASSAGRDVSPVADDDPRALVRTRGWIVLISLSSMLLALSPFAGIVTITALAGSLYAACFLPTLVGGLYWRGGTSAGAVACVVVGAATVITWHFARRVGWTSSHEIYAGTAVSAAVYLSLSRASSSSATTAATADSLPPAPWCD